MLTAALIALAVAAGWVVSLFVRAPYRPDFDEHTRTALALLDPDNPDLPAARPLSYIEQVEAYLAEHAPKES